MTDPIVFEVRKSDLSDGRVNSLSQAELQDGQVRLRIDQFALTANNITYAAFGDAMQYWNFFPAEDGWGRIPVWGFATVEASAASGIEVGERVYGYFPMATHLTIDAGRVSAHGFSDVAAHRAGLADIYNRYTRTTTDTAYSKDTEAEQMLFRPLFTTSWLIDDMLAESGFHGASTVILSSASSKTALALAACIATRDGIEAVGLTSPSNREFVEGTGLYARVVAYDDVSALDATPSLYVDFAGSPAITRSVHTHLQDQLKFSLMVGATDWDADRQPTSEALPGPEPVFFFAPDLVSQRIKTWGAEAYTEQLNKAQSRFFADARNWIRPVISTGPDALLSAYKETLAGKTTPDRGLILSL